MAQILIAHTDQTVRRGWAAELDADGYTVHEAATVTAAVQMLAAVRIELLLLGALERPSSAPSLLADLRHGRLDATVDPGLAVVTVGPVDEISQLRAYDAGCDHHVAEDTPYLVLRVIITALARRLRADAGRPRQIQHGSLIIDAASREVRVDGELVETTKREFALLAALAADPTRVYTKQELSGELWGYSDASASRTLDSHACRLRNKLASHGQRMIICQRGVGYRLTDTV